MWNFWEVLQGKEPASPGSVGLVFLTLPFIDPTPLHADIMASVLPSSLMRRP